MRGIVVVDKVNEADARRQGAGSAGWGFVALAALFCAPSFAFHACGVLGYYTGREGLYGLALVSAALSPAAFGVAIIVGLIGLLQRRAGAWVRFALILLLAATLMMQLYLWKHLQGL